MQCTDDSNRARPCIVPSGEGHLLRELQDGLIFGPAAVRSLRVGEDHANGTLDPRAVGPGSDAIFCLGRIAVGPMLRIGTPHYGAAHTKLSTQCSSNA